MLWSNVHLLHNNNMYKMSKVMYPGDTDKETYKVMHTRRIIMVCINALK